MSMSDLFNAYGDHLLEGVLEDMQDVDHISVGGEKVKTIKFMDDQALMAKS